MDLDTEKIKIMTSNPNSQMNMWKHKQNKKILKKQATLNSHGTGLYNINKIKTYIQRQKYWHKNNLQLSTKNLTPQ